MLKAWLWCIFLSNMNLCCLYLETVNGACLCQETYARGTFTATSLRVFWDFQEPVRFLANLRTIISILQTDVRHLCNTLQDNFSDILLISENSLLQILLLHQFPMKPKEMMFYRSSGARTDEALQYSVVVGQEAPSPPTQYSGTEWTLLYRVGEPRAKPLGVTITQVIIKKNSIDFHLITKYLWFSHQNSLSLSQTVTQLSVLWSEYKLQDLGEGHSCLFFCAAPTNFTFIKGLSDT